MNLRKESRCLENIYQETDILSAVSQSRVWGHLSFDLNITADVIRLEGIRSEADHYMLHILKSCPLHMGGNELQNKF